MYRGIPPQQQRGPNDGRTRAVVGMICALAEFARDSDLIRFDLFDRVLGKLMPRDLAGIFGLRVCCFRERL
jgi:hypothetical protein